MKANSTIRHSSNGSVSTPAISLVGILPQLKAKVGKRLVRQFGRVVPGSLIGRALDEAIEAAASTGFPHLFFPLLAEEKVQLVSRAVREELHERPMLRHAA